MMNRTKIVCTIGPSTWDENTLRQMIDNGMTCARVNGAFADPQELDKVANLIRSISPKVSLMVDVKGPEIRLNKFPEVKKIKAGDIVEIGNDESSEMYPANYKDVYTFVQPNQRIVIGDGDTELKIKEIRGTLMLCEVVYGKQIKPGKALNLPGVNYSTEVLTPKDKENLQHAIQTGWDFVSASFIRNKESAQLIKNFINSAPMQLIAKIEDEEGVNNIDEILEVVDGVMIARGGLGVEAGLEKMGLFQRTLTQKCKEAGKPSITATQMLESMTENPRPTRAEASDATTAVLLGTDSLMLSGETSSGLYPVEAVKFLSSIITTVHPTIQPHIINKRSCYSSTTEGLTNAAAELCMSLQNEIAGIVVVTFTGATARLLSRHELKQPIYAFTKNEHLVRTLSIVKNVVEAFSFDGMNTHDRDSAVEYILNKIRELSLFTSGQKILLMGKGHKNEAYFPNIFEILEV